MKPQGSSSPRPLAALWISLALMGTVLLLYGRVAGHAFINFDDDTYVSENPHVLGGLTREGVGWAFTTTTESNWHPLTWLSHMLDAELYGDRPGGHHVTSVVLHAINAALLFLAFLSMSGRLWPPALVAALFAVHPLRVESVAWVAERKDVLSGSFWMLAMLAYASYARRPTPLRYALILVALALGLLAKPMLVTLPFALLLLDFWPLGRLRPGSRTKDTLSALGPLLLEKLPFFLLAALSSAITIVVQRRGGAASSLETVPLGARLVNAAISYAAYLWKTIVPVRLAIFYPHPSFLSHAISVPRLVAAVLAACVLALLTVLAPRAATRRPFLAVGWLWYLGTLIPVIGLVQVGRQGMADRYTYLPLIGVYVALAWTASDLVSARPRARGALVLSAAAALAALMTATWVQVGFWRDGATLYRHTLAVTSGNYLIHNSLGVTLVGQGKLDEGEEHFRTAIVLRPDFVEGHSNLGNVLERRGELEAAQAEYEAALRIRPRHAGALAGLGTVLARRGDLAGAVARLEEAVRLDPSQVDPRKSLAVVLTAQGELLDAAVQYQEAARIRPEDPDVHSSLGILLMRIGRRADAEAELELALRIQPHHAGASAALAELRAIGGRVR